MIERRERYFRWLLSHRLAVLLVAAAVVAVAVIGASRTSVDYTIEQLFPARGASRQTFDEYKQAFSKEDLRFSLVWRDSRPPGVDLFRDMQRAARQFEEVGLRDVDWIGSVPVAEPEVLDGEQALHVNPLVEEELLSDEYIRAVLARYRDDNLYRGYLWDAGQTSFAIHGYLDEESANDLSRRQIEEDLSERLASLELPGVETALGGIPVFRSRLPKLLETDQKLLLGGGFLLFAAILFLFFRSVAQIVLCLVSAIPAYLVTIGLMGYLGISISVLTSFIPIIVLVVGVSDSIHLLARYRKELRRPGMSGGSDGGRRREAVTRTLSHLAIPCFYTSLTTAVGFLSLVSTRIGIVMEFGAFTALAILATFGFSMTVFPVLLSFASARGLDDRGLHIRWIQQIVQGAAHLAANPSRTVLAAFVVVALLGLGAAASLRTNTLLMDDLRPRSGLLQDIRWIEQNGYGLFQVNLYLREDDRGSLHDPEVLVWMEAFQEFVSRDPLVVGTLGLPDYLRQLRRAMVDSDAPESSLPESSLPESREEASQLLFMAELQDADFAHDVYHREDGEAQVLVTVRDKGSVVILPLLERIDRYLADNPLPVGTVRPTGTVYLLQSYQARILESFGPSLIIALVVITGIMIYMFRSWRYGLIALIPNLFPLVVLLGVMRLGSFDLKPSTILVFSIAFGIAADDTIHLLGRFRQAIERGLGVTAALVDSVRDAGPAILMTTLVVGTGFSLLMASQFEVLFLVGLMTAVSALSAVIADLFAFPSIIRARWFGRRSYSAGLAATSLALAVLALRHGESVAQTPAEGRGRAIAEEADRRARGYGDLEARLTMVLRNRHGEERTRTMTMSLLEGAGANDKTLLVIDQPRDLQGTALLTHAESTGDDSQWLYLPALKRVKRIASGGQTGSFMGSEFSYEDIGSQGLDEYTYRFLGEEIIESEACLSVERVPVDPESGYARQVVFFDTGEYRVRQIDFYDRNGLLLKTLRLTGFQQYEGSFWRPDLMEMTNHQTGKSTSILWDEYRFDVGLTDRDFDRDRLKRAG